jgi:hypothetical protein
MVEHNQQLLINLVINILLLLNRCIIISFINNLMAGVRLRVTMVYVQKT